MDAELRKAILNYKDYGISPTGTQFPKLVELARGWGYDTSSVYRCPSCLHGMLNFLGDYLVENKL